MHALAIVAAKTEKDPNCLAHIQQSKVQCGAGEDPDPSIMLCARHMPRSMWDLTRIPYTPSSTGQRRAAGRSSLDPRSDYPGTYQT